MSNPVMPQGTDLFGKDTCVPVVRIEAAANEANEAKPQLKVLAIMRATDRVRYTHGHPTSATTPILCKFLLDAGFEVELINNLDRVKNPDDKEGLNYFDAVIFHGKIEQADDETVRALRTFVEGGKGLIVVHIASASFAPNGPQTVSDDWRNLIGSAFVYGISGHPVPKEIKVRLADPAHPIVAGIPAEFTIQEDELYQNMSIAQGGAGCPLAHGTTLDDAGNPVTEPVAFTLERGQGRVFHMYLGHFISVHRDWRFQQMITQGVKWVAQR
jgi:type 1 glutamine amidotransferase